MLLALPLLVVACSASPQTIADAKEEAKNRGFSVLSETSTGASILFSEEVTVQVSFGENGCTGSIWFKEGAATLYVTLPIPGSATETTSVAVDDPRVDRLREDTAFKTCFAAPDSRPTT